jgi:hypothetical protein
MNFKPYEAFDAEQKEGKNIYKELELLTVISSGNEELAIKIIEAHPPKDNSLIIDAIQKSMSGAVKKIKARWEYVDLPWDFPFSKLNEVGTLTDSLPLCISFACDSLTSPFLISKLQNPKRRFANTWSAIDPFSHLLLKSKGLASINPTDRYSSYEIYPFIK